MIEILGLVTLIFFFIVLIQKFKNNLNIFFLSILFFPFIFKDKTGYFLFQNFKDIYLLLCSSFLYINYLLPKYKKNIKLINYFYWIVLICILTPLINLIYNYDNIFITSSFIRNFSKSLIIPVCSITLFFVAITNINKEKLNDLLKSFYFIMLVIFFEFLISLVVKNFVDIRLISLIYPDNIFRSVFINGHITTMHYFIFAYFLGFYFFSINNNKLYLFINLLFFILIIYNIESRLTIGAFIFTNMMLIYRFFEKNDFNEKTALFYCSVYLTLLILFMLIMLNIFQENFTSLQPEQIKFLFLSFDFWSTPIIERINSNIFYIENLISNNIIGFGYDNAGSYPTINNSSLLPKIFINNFDHFSYALLNNYGFAAFHGEISRIHSGIINFFVSFGIMSLILIVLFYRILNLSIFNLKNNCKLNQIILTIISFFICSSYLNYLYEVEILVVLLFSSYLILKKKNEI